MDRFDWPNEKIPTSGKAGPKWGTHLLVLYFLLLLDASHYWIVVTNFPAVV